MRLIDANEVIKHLEKCIADPMFDNDYRKICFAICKYIDDVPTIEAEPVKHGRWVKHRIEKYDNYGNYTNAPGLTDCSNCNFSAYGIAEIYNFCPQCGVRMDGDDNA